MASHGVARPATVFSRSEHEKVKENNEIQEYRELENTLRVKVAEQGYTLEAFNLTSKLLKKNPEYYTLWNIRRRALLHSLFSTTLYPSLHPIEHVTLNSTSQTLHPTIKPEPDYQKHDKEQENNVLELITSDLAFLFPIMLKFPKCYWIWNYRLWLLQQANESLNPKISRELWDKELKLVGKMLIKDSRNFHGWGYRRIVVAQLESSKLNGSSMVESEFEYTTKMIKAPNGLSNFSAWHWRSKLIPGLLNERGLDSSARRQFLNNEFNLIISAMYTDSYPYQQSAWFYYQFLMTALIEPDLCPIVLDFNIKERCEYVQQQLEILKEMLDGAEDCKWIYNALIDYTLALRQLQKLEVLSEDKLEFKIWLKALKSLDPFRKGRWDDFEDKLATFS
ncbi:Geranylgeranyl transferase type-2 subunit alpha [Erysiphe neolycopersici]|uniref:Geranylgeranyl transferase type-2 subunit alpha n=1 Tax=Erysiphe neolycopersici TaxID=212602 RepID=A0A420HX22_9PEZI|nr:Geranylgeranyl transferase type-2 subunit alpha [Erysiphe neolycopersici]